MLRSSLLRTSVAVLFIASLIAGVLYISLQPNTILVAQTPTEPEFPVCSAGFDQVLQFGGGDSFLIRPDKIEALFSFNVAPDQGPNGEVLVWQGEGHLWDQGCNVGPDNDPDRRPPCDQNQLEEIITFTVNADGIGQFVDHGATDDNFFYTFPFSNAVEGPNQLGLHHLNQGASVNSVFYKGVVCVASAPTPTSTSTATSTATSTPTNTPTATTTNTPTNTPTATATNTPTNTPTSTATPTPTATGTITATATNTPTPTPTNTITATATNTPTPTATSTATPTELPPDTVTVTPTPSVTPTVTPTPTATDDTTEPTNLDPEPQPDQAVPPCNNDSCQYLPLLLP